MVKIGDRIVGKKTGTLTPSTVIAILPCYMTALYREPLRRWLDLYPDYREKLIVVSEFDIPQKNISMEDAKVNAILYVEKFPFAKDFYDLGLVDKIAEYFYETTELTLSVTYPIDDVEVL
jgi:hypothetical protein